MTKGGSAAIWAASPALRQLIQEVQPTFACFGHYDRPSDYFLGMTRVLGLGGCGYHTFGEWRVKPNGIVLVEWKDSEAAMEWLKPDWLAGATQASWRQW